MLTTSPSQPPPPRASAVNEQIASGLGEGKQRFLAQVVAHALASGRRTAEDFLRHFPPKDIMRALADQPRLRANIAVPTIGLNEKVALKKSPDSMGEDLQIALEEGVTDAESIVRLFEPDDRVRHLDERKLWAFLSEGDFWRASAEPSARSGVGKQHVAFILDCARANGLLNDLDIVEGLTLERLVDLLPKTELSALVRTAVGEGRHGRPFDDEKLLRALPPSTLVDHVPLNLVWECVVMPRIAAPHALASRGPSAAPPLLPDDDEIIVELVDRDSNLGSPPATPQKSRRIGAVNLSELKGEIADPKKSRN